MSNNHLQALESKVPSFTDDIIIQQHICTSLPILRKFCFNSCITPAGDACFAEDILQPDPASKKTLSSGSEQRQLVLLLGVVLEEGRREAEVEGGEESFQV